MNKLNVKMVYYIVAAVLVLCLLGELLGVHLHGASWWPVPLGYNVFFGFVGGWVLIILAKMIMAPLLQRDEDYYNPGGEKDE